MISLQAGSTHLAAYIALAVCIAAQCGCSRADRGAAGADVVVYAALDREFSEPILNDFTKEAGIAVLSKFDPESTKTVGLTSEIVAEARQPACDVFWNNEILNTLRLEKLGLLEPFHPPTADAFAAKWRSPNDTWFGIAARARILIVNKKLIEGKAKPQSINDLLDPAWRGQIGMAKPLFGTTATH